MTPTSWSSLALCSCMSRQRKFSANPGWLEGTWLWYQFLSIHPHRMRGTGIFTYIYHKNQPNVGKYTSPMDPMGSFGPWNSDWYNKKSNLIFLPTKYPTTSTEVLHHSGLVRPSQQENLALLCERWAIQLFNAFYTNRLYTNIGHLVVEENLEIHILKMICSCRIASIYKNISIECIVNIYAYPKLLLSFTCTTIWEMTNILTFDLLSSVRQNQTTSLECFFRYVTQANQLLVPFTRNIKNEEMEPQSNHQNLGTSQFNLFTIKHLNGFSVEWTPNQKLLEYDHH